MKWHLRVYLFWFFLTLLLMLQWPLLFAKGSVLSVQETRLQLEKLEKINDQLSLRNDALRVEIEDLKHGTAAIEERARYHLGMIKPTENFYRVHP
jgi:cell division protein FtsB